MVVAGIHVTCLARCLEHNYLLLGSLFKSKKKVWVGLGSVAQSLEEECCPCPATQNILTYSWPTRPRDLLDKCSTAQLYRQSWLPRPREEHLRSCTQHVPPKDPHPALARFTLKPWRLLTGRRGKMLAAFSAHACAFEFTSGAFLRPVRHLCQKRKVDRRENCEGVGWGEGMCILSQALAGDLGVLSCFVFPNGLFRIPPSPVTPSSHA